MNAPGQDPREAAWVALAELYLDTDIADRLPAIAHELAATPFDLDSLERILWDEVHPALRANLASVAGEWAGFERSWLLQRIERVRRRPRLLRWLTAPVQRGLVRADWAAVRAQVQCLRQDAAAAGKAPGRQ